MTSILIVDDEAAVRHLVTRWVESAGYRASTAASADEALETLVRQPAAIALCDVRMPGHDGLWLADKIRSGFPETAVIMASAARDTNPRVAEHTGAVDYLVKPFGRERLTFALARAFDWHYEAADRREWLGRLNHEAAERLADLRASVAAIQRSAADPLEGLLGLIGDDDSDLVTHSRRVAVVAQRIGRALGLRQPELAALHEAALLHDLGKLAMPHMILRKPAALSLDEKAIVRRHPDIAAQMLLSIGGLETAAAVLRASSGRFDEHASDSPSPSDQPDPVRLAGGIVAVAAAYDAMTHRQIYREPLPSSEAASELLRCSSTQFDPVVVSVLLEMLGESAAIH